MTETLTFDNMTRLLHQQLEQPPDHRKGKNTRYAIKDAGLGAFAVFHSIAFVFVPSTADEAYQGAE